MSGLGIDKYEFLHAIAYGNFCQHYEKAKGNQNWFGHAVIAIIEAPPIIGQIIALIEVIIAKIAARFTKTKSLNSFELWDILEAKKFSLNSTVVYHPSQAVNHRFDNIGCPKNASICIEDRFLHANKVTSEKCGARPIVASQAPLEIDCELFWKAISLDNFAIVDLTTTDDIVNGGVNKYYPEFLGETITFGSMSITLTKEEGALKEYLVKDGLKGQFKTIKRFHFKNWKDFGAVTVPVLADLIRQLDSSLLNAPLWVHCRAGVGRTGTLITAYMLKHKIQMGEINSKNLDSSLVDMIHDFRQKRGPSFVQQVGQFELLHQYGQFLLK